MIAEAAKLSLQTTIGALIIAHTILGVPYYKYSIMGPKSPILLIKAPIVGFPRMVKNAHENIREMICIGTRLRDLASILGTKTLEFVRVLQALVLEARPAYQNRFVVPVHCSSVEMQGRNTAQSACLHIFHIALVS